MNKDKPKEKDKIKEVEKELQRVKNELNTFYEITQAMRRTLNFDEIIYIILTGLTSHHGLGYNRAVLFSVDYQTKKIKGVMGIGPYNAEEAKEIWKYIEQEKKSLEDLIEEYKWIKDGSKRTKFYDFVKNMELPYSSEAGLIYKVFNTGEMIYLDEEKVKELSKDKMCELFCCGEAVLVPLSAKNQVGAVLFVDNFITKKKITKENLRILNMFSSQAGLALENSKIFEDTLSKAHTDSLTSLWNYGYFQYKLDEQISFSEQRNLTFGLLMIDIDDFKKYNDTFGHLQGDTALVQIGSIIKDNCRRQDVVCRYGGEEFVVILPEISHQSASMIAERIRESVEKENDLFKHIVTVSIGISFFPSDSLEKRSLINKADQCLYKAKNAGKNTVISL